MSEFKVTSNFVKRVATKPIEGLSTEDAELVYVRRLQSILIGFASPSSEAELLTKFSNALTHLKTIEKYWQGFLNLAVFLTPSGINIPPSATVSQVINGSTTQQKRELFQALWVFTTFLSQAILAQLV